MAKTADKPGQQALSTTRIRNAGRHALPFISLAVSVSSAITMDRSERRAPWVAAAAIATFMVLALASVLTRSEVARPSRPSTEPRESFHPETARTFELTRVASFLATTASTSLVQLALTFSAPFYFASASYSLPQSAFLALSSGVTCVALWDPWAARLLARPLLGAALCAFASFMALNVALPMLGLAHVVALPGAASISALAFLLLSRVQRRSLRSGLAGELSGAAAIVALALLLAFAIPPAPLALTDAAIGTAVAERTLSDRRTHFESAPASLVCFTAIRAPLGLHDQLTHVWRRNGQLLQRVTLNVIGGRRQGFRTWSRLTRATSLAGEVSCDVVTAFGQSLGSATVLIGSRH